MTVNTLTMGPGTLTVGETGSPMSLQSQLTNARVEPSVDRDDPTTVLSGEQVAGDRTETWTLSGTILQDFGTADGVSEWTFTNAGQTLPFTFTPNTSAGRAVSGQVTVEATTIGGDVPTKATSDFEWQVIGRPTLGTAPDAGDGDIE